MFRREIREVPEKYVADLAGNSAVGRVSSWQKPIGTCGNISGDDVPIAIRHSHSIGLAESISMIKF